MFKIFNKKKQEISSEDCFNKVCDALYEVMPEELRNIELLPKTKIETLGIDSIKYINLFISLEEIIGKELDEVVDAIDVSSIKTVDDIVKLVNELKSNSR